MRPVMVPGACDDVINPDELPDDAAVVLKTIGNHFSGANDSVVDNYGDVGTIVGSDLGAIGCGW